MKNCILVVSMLISFLSFGQNLMVNGNWEATGLMNSVPTPWMSINSTQVVKDVLTNSQCANINNGNGTLYQVFSVTPNVTYNVVFDYKWVSGTGSYNMTVNIKDGASEGSDLGTLVLNTTPDIWHTGSFSFTAPTGVTTARVLFFKDTGNSPLRIDNVYIAPQRALPSFVDSNTPINAQPIGVAGGWDLDFSDEFNGVYINTSKWVVSVSNTSRGARTNLGVTDWWWKAGNAFLNSTGNLVLRGTKVDNNTMYCGSVESKNLYEPTYGYLEARIQIAETSKGNHTAFWTQGHNQGNVNNSAADGAEIDIFESAWLTDNTGVAIHFDGYDTFKKNYGFSYNAANLHNGYHIYGLLWTATTLDVYYDGVKVVSKNPNRSSTLSVDTNGYPVVPQVPEWLWLSVGASFVDGDFQSQPIGTLSDALVDYVRVYKASSSLAFEVPSMEKKFLLYPNPINNTVTIKSDEKNYLLHVYDLNGREIMNTQKSNTATIDVSSFAKGMYIFKLTSNNTTKDFKIIVE